jgi:hypothetical protein
MLASIKWRHLGHLQLFSRVVAVMAEMEVSHKRRRLTRKE